MRSFLIWILSAAPSDKFFFSFFLWMENSLRSLFSLNLLHSLSRWSMFVNKYFPCCSRCEEISALSHKRELKKLNGQNDLSLRLSSTVLWRQLQLQLMPDGSVFVTFQPSPLPNICEKNRQCLRAATVKFELKLSAMLSCSVIWIYVMWQRFMNTFLSLYVPSLTYIILLSFTRSYIDFSTHPHTTRHSSAEVRRIWNISL